MFTKTDIEKYFNAEKSESLLFIIIGIAGIIIAINLLIFLKTNFYKGASIPLLAIGLLLTVVGFRVYKKSDADRIRNVYALDMNQSELKEKEIPRMQKVMKNFTPYRYVEILLILIGIGLFYYYKDNDAQQFWKGFGIALAIMAMLSLFADYFAEKRGKIYLDGLISTLTELKN